MADNNEFYCIANELELAGLSWRPEIGDEICQRKEPVKVSVLVNSQALTVAELKETYLWLPTVEQMVKQLEARQAMLYHAGFEFDEQGIAYKTVLQSPSGQIMSSADSLRKSIGLSLRNLLLGKTELMH